MSKKLPELLFIAVCLLLALTLSAGFLLFGPAPAGANERLTAPPKLVSGEDGALNESVLSELSAYYSDHFFLRQELITARNALSALLGTSGTADVIVGSEGWLYYAPTLPDYTGAAPMSAGELFSAVRNLWLMQEYCESRGAKFLFTAAPNKNSLYPAHMPDYGAAAETHDAQRLYTLLEAQGVSYADLFLAFGARDEVLYFAHDSHWNSRGAALAVDVLNGAFGRESSYFSQRFTTGNAHQGDLFEMLYPAAADRETDLIPENAPRYVREGKETRPDSITIRTDGEGSGSLLCFRDSFGNLLYPYLADSFDRALFSRAAAYDLRQIDATEADFVLVELVERNLRDLTTEVPVMPAPARRLALPEGSTGAVALARETPARAPEGCVLLRGEYPAARDAASPVYVLCADGAYEAFTLADGFAAYLPADAEPVGIACLVNGALACFSAAK